MRLCLTRLAEINGEFVCVFVSQNISNLRQNHSNAMHNGLGMVLKTELFRRSYGTANYRPQQH